MDLRWMRGLAVALSFGAVACAGNLRPEVGLEAGTFAEWDANRDGMLATGEFGPNWDDTFGVWDDDDSGFVETDEWGVGVGDDGDEFGAFDTWDMNDDGLLSDDEFMDGSFGVFDDDDDGLISNNEWGVGFGIWD